MIYLTTNQLNCFLIFLCAGFLSAMIYNLISITFCLNYGKIFKKIIINSIFYSIFAVFFVFLINFFNFGKFSISLLAGLILGFLWLNKLVSILVVFLQSKWYTILNSKKRKVKPKHESKLKG